MIVEEMIGTPNENRLGLQAPVAEEGLDLLRGSHIVVLAQDGEDGATEISDVIKSSPASDAPTSGKATRMRAWAETPFSAASIDIRAPKE